MKRTIFAFIALIAITSCNKTEGPGGTSTLTGTVQAMEHDDGRPEITEVIFTPGINIEHGDYWILNKPTGLNQFYIYYDNPEWVSEADPELEGRIGVSVSFNYSDSNIEIAENTKEAIETTIPGEFDIIRHTDILTFYSKSEGAAPDADRVTTPFEVNVAQQGQNDITYLFEPAVDEKVYLVYGSNEVYGELTRTGGNGEYRFDNLTKGNYTVYSVSKDTSAVFDATINVIQKVEITENKSSITVDEIRILK